MESSNKKKLVNLLSISQIVCLIIAISGFAFWIRGSVHGIVRSQIMEDNRLIAGQMAKLIESSRFGNVEYQSENWEKLQTLIEEVSLPNSGFMCVADTADGRLLCHPEIRTYPELREAKIALAPLIVDHETTSPSRVVQASRAKRSGPVTGIMGSGDSAEIVTVVDLPALNGILLVHQGEAAFRAAVNRLLTPIFPIGLIVGCGLILAMKKVNDSIMERYENKIEEINRGLEDTVTKRTKALTRTRNAVIFGLAKLSESRDNDTGEHLTRIRTYTTILARELSRHSSLLDSAIVEDIGLASSLHDIGKVGVHDAVLLKPGRLDAYERTVIERHTRIGQDCLEAIEKELGEDNFLRLATEICAYHHEKWDGTGYPNGLAGENIPLSARIVALADVYDALRSKRPYKDGMSHATARRIIVEGKGSHFDPEVVDAFLRTESDFLKYSMALSEEDCHDLESAMTHTSSAEILPQTLVLI